MTRPDAENLVKWLLEQSSKIDYGEISIKLVRHGGKVKFIEKTVASKEQLPDG